MVHDLKMAQSCLFISRSFSFDFSGEHVRKEGKGKARAFRAKTQEKKKARRLQAIGQKSDPWKTSNLCGCSFSIGFSFPYMSLRSLQALLSIQTMSLRANVCSAQSTRRRQNIVGISRKDWNAKASCSSVGDVQSLTCSVRLLFSVSGDEDHYRMPQVLRYLPN